jgi:putative heme-binding domain-containing protein
LWLAHATLRLDDTNLLSLLEHASPYVISWAIQLLCEDQQVPETAIQRFQELAASVQSDAMVRLYLASAMNRLELDQRWGIAEALASHEADSNDKNIPLVAWYGIEPLVVKDPKRALALANTCRIPLVSQYIMRRAAADSVGLDALVAAMIRWPAEQQVTALEQILQSMEGRVNVPQPKEWADAYEQLAKSESLEIKDLALRAAVAFGDQRAFPQLRERLIDKNQPLAERQSALEILVKGRDKELGPSLFAILDTEELQSPAIRALSAVADSTTPDKLLGSTRTEQDRARRCHRNACVSCTVCPEATRCSGIRNHRALRRACVPCSADGQPQRSVPRRADQSILGKVGTSSEEQKESIEKYKAQLTKKVLAKADLGQGRLLFNKHCMACHQLFGAGEKVGPDLTGSNRADLNYILENLVAPNAVVGKDYQMTLLQLDDSRVLSGLLIKETDSAVTLRTINDLVVVAKEEIDQRKLSDLSLMPNGLLDPLSQEEVRDLIGYLASPSQVPIRGPRPDFDGEGKVLGAFEGEAMKVVAKSRGSAQGQDMRGFSMDRWSDGKQMWWTGAQPNDTLHLEFHVAAAGKYEPQVVLTQARDYAIVQLLIDDVPLGEPIDGFNTPEVITTGVIKFASREFTPGNHILQVKILGKHPQAVPGYMVGIDFLKLA